MIAALTCHRGGAALAEKLVVRRETLELALSLAPGMAEVLRPFGAEPFLLEDAVVAHRAAVRKRLLSSAEASEFFRLLARLGILAEAHRQVVYPGGEVRELLRWNVVDPAALANLPALLAERLAAEPAQG